MESAGKEPVIAVKVVIEMCYCNIRDDFIGGES